MTTDLKDLTILHHNVMSWTNKKITLGNIYRQIDPDIILLNEHNVTDDETLKIYNYNIYTTNKENERHAGAAIGIRKGLTFRLHDDFYSDFIGLTVTTRQGPITIATAYVPPRRNYINIIDLNKVLRQPHPTYIFADFNARHRLLGNTVNNSRGNNIATLINQDKCRHIGPTFPTYINHTGSTTPDIVLTNRLTFHNIFMTPGPITPSDHIPIIAYISANPIQTPIKPRLHYHKADWTKYKDELTNIDIPSDPTPTLEQIDDYLTKWTDEIKRASTAAIPKIAFRIIPGIKPNHKTLTIQTQYQDLRHDIATNGPSLDRFRQLIQLRRRLSTEYRTQANDNWNKIINNINIQPNPKLFWRSIKRMCGRNNKQELPYIKHNNIKLNSPQQKEPIFRDHWRQIYSGQDDDENIFDYDHINDIEDQLGRQVNLLSPLDSGDLNRLNDNFPPISLDELNRTIRQTRQRAPGPTEITALQLKNLPTNMKKYLLYIFNHAISAGYFPDSLKHATLIFIPKPGTSQLNVKNFRPISLLDTHSKLLDKILNNRLYDFLDLHDRLNPRQHGFRPHRGTHTALATFQETIANNLADKNNIDIVLRDVSKAFDKVWLNGLKYKIIQLHLHSSFIRTLIDFLTDRTASIRINNHTGPSFQLHSGVPQGSCLSPTLYSFFTHDLPPPLPNTEYIAYADDITQIITSRGSPQTIANVTCHAIQQINTFENKWKIKTNTSKFIIIPISRRNTWDIFIDDTYIPYSRRGKMLGLNLTTYGFSNQTKIRRAIATSQLTKLNRFSRLNITNKRKLYLALVRSALTYPVIPLHTCSNSALLQLQRTQNKATRLLTNTTNFDRLTSQILHEMTELPAINVFLHETARNLWQTLSLTDPDLYARLQPTEQLLRKQHRLFPSSLLASRQPTPEPLYR